MNFVDQEEKEDGKGEELKQQREGKKDEKVKRGLISLLNA